MAKQKQKRVAKHTETDGVYLLKLAMYMILASFWVRISFGGTTEFSLPAGFILGILFASNDYFQIDRKIEYAVLLVAMFIGFWLPIGLYISL